MDAITIKTKFAIKKRDEVKPEKKQIQLNKRIVKKELGKETKN